MTVPQIFDRRLVQAHRDRAARNFPHYDFLHRAAATRLVERFLDIDARLKFPRILTVGDSLGAIDAAMREQNAHHRRDAVEFWLAGDLSHKILAAPAQRNATPFLVQMDEERLPIAEKSFAAIFSLLTLHWVNDLPGAMIQYFRALQPDGVFLAALWGEQSLIELREACIRAEWAEYGGAGPRFSPSLDGRDLAQIMMRAGFALPVVERETLTVFYGSLPKLLHDIRFMAENNALLRRSRRPLTRRFWARLGEFYPPDAEGRYRLTLDMILLTGWHPPK
ncbi:MAG: methyltransferase domain-containing protein [Candidatus Symbiobacter sp.]|nr:methyltransferase domain-containing protein [Candidatus Symbiobacter sp.]